VLIEQEGRELFDTEEEVRLLCKRLRFGYDLSLDERLRRKIQGLDSEQLRKIVRAFSVYFQLVNIAERYHRIRRRRQYESSPSNPPQRASLASALSRLEGEGLGAERLEEVLDGMSVGLVLTAHPTEAMRRSVRRKHAAIGEMLEALESGTLTWKERRRLEESLAEEVTLLWQTDELRVRRPEVTQEIERTLLFFENPLISATLDVYRELEDELARRFGEDAPEIGRVLEFGSWVGGDQDGNPFVRPGTLSAALELHRELILKRHRSSVLSLVDHMSQSARLVRVSEELLASVERDEGLLGEAAERFRDLNPYEIYRRKLLLVGERLRRTLGGPGSPAAYPSVADFVEDLSIVRRSLLEHGGERIAHGDLRDLIRQAEVFGFHLAKLDVRQESSRIVKAVAELVSTGTGEDLTAMGEAARTSLLRRLIVDEAALDSEGVSEGSREVLETFERIRLATDAFSEPPVETFI
ncbi:MAG TPA: phosphoenolpyruvate carboxylase, partial [Rubrobacteraceae bacterium]|nr:phosphoenolpyruvate carboxylase [Rubrobacteraceae bacterium]